MIKKLMIGLLVCTFFLTGCASFQVASIEMDKQAKTFSVQPGKANIYVYKDFRQGGTAYVDLDDKPVGETYSYDYMVFEVDPGKHQLASRADNYTVVEVDAVAGKNYFVRQVIYPGLFNGFIKNLLVDDEEGKAGVLECELLEAKPAQ